MIANIARQALTMGARTPSASSSSSVLAAAAAGAGARSAALAAAPAASLLVARRSYHESVIDHFNNPRNVGKLDGKKKNVGNAFVGKASCGDVIKLQIEVDEATGNIKDAKFKTFGCGSAIASSSVATEMIIGKNVNDAVKLRNTDISAHLNLPPVKIHCSVLAEEAIQAAVEDYQNKQKAAE